MEASRRAASASAQAGMELCWRSAWGVFTVGALVDRPFPLPQAAAAFLAAAALTRLGRGRGWRVYEVLGLQAVGFTACVLAFLYAASDSPFAWWTPQWVQVLWGSPKGLAEWMSLSLALFWAVAFWVGGVALVRRPVAYSAVCTRFDVGVVAFLVLFLVRWLVAARAGVEAAGVAPEALLFAYWIFSLFALVLARQDGTGQAQFLPRKRGVGALLSVVASLVLLGSGAILFFVPYLIAAAETGYAVMRRASGPLGPVLLQVLRFLLLGQRVQVERPRARASGNLGTIGGSLGSHGEWWERIFGVLKWGVWGLVGAVLLGAVVYSTWRLLRWLLGRTSADGERGAGPGMQTWLRALWAALGALLLRLCGRRRGATGAREFYASLRAWGGRSGLPPVPSETPLEYCSRLIRRFPFVAKEIGTIVSLFNEEVYAERAAVGEHLAAGARARKRLRNPRFWPSRLNSWLFRPEAD